MSLLKRRLLLFPFAGRKRLTFLLDFVASDYADDAGPLASPIVGRKGQLTLVQVDGNFSFSGGRLVFPAQATPTYNDQEIYDATARTHAAGLAYLLKIAASASGIMWTGLSALVPPAVGGFSSLHSGFRHSSGSLLSSSGVNLGAYGTTLWSLISLLRNEGDLEFINDGSGWRLAWRSPLNIATTVYSVFQNYSQAGEIHRMRLASLLANAYPVAGTRDLDLCSPGTGTGTSSIAVPVAGNTAIMTADAFIKYTVTTLPSAGPMELYYRRNSANGYAFYLAIDSAGGISLNYYDGEYHALATAGAGTVTNGAVISIKCVGTDHRIYVNGTLVISQTSSFNLTNTGIYQGSLGTGGVIANLTAKTLDGIAQRAVTALVDHGGNGLNGVPTKVAFVGTQDGGGQYDGATSYTNIYSAGMNALFDGAVGTVIVRAKVANAGVWTDGAYHSSLVFRTDATNYVDLIKSSSNNRLVFRFNAGGVSREINKNGVVTTDFMTLGQTWNKNAGADGEFKAFYDGVQEGVTATTLGTWVGALAPTTCNIGAQAILTQHWPGSIKDAIMSNIVASPADQATIHTALAAGTLTHAMLDTIFEGRANYVWYDHKERRWLNDGVTVSSNYPGVGLGTSVMPGPLAVGDAFTHEADGIIEFQLDALPVGSAIYIYFRKQDFSNTWWVQIQADGTFALYDLVAGTPTWRAATGAGALVGGERIIVDFRGTTIKGYYNTTLAWSYASATNFQTKTDGVVYALGSTPGRISNLLSWPATPASALLTPGASSINAALTAMGA